MASRSRKAEFRPDLNELAARVTLAEGNKVRLSIAQVKEVLARLGDVLADEPAPIAVATFHRLMWVSWLRLTAEIRPPAVRAPAAKKGGETVKKGKGGKKGGGRGC